jgi:Bacterial Ig domain
MNTTRILALCILSVFTAQLLAPLNMMVFADNTTYYVDATLGSDAASGTTLGTPWQSLDRINTEALLPWDQVLLKCGETWTGQILLDDSGNPGSPITYGSYGTCNPANKPIIAASGSLSQVAASGSQSNIQIDGLNFVGDATVSVDISGSGNTFSIANSSFANTVGSCVQIPSAEDYVLSSNTFSGCVSTVVLGSGSGIVTGNTFTNTLSGNALSMGLTSSGTRQVTGNTFTNIAGSAIQFGQNAQITTNYIVWACVNSASCGAIENTAQDEFSGSYTYDLLDLNASISDNFIENTGLNSPIIGYRDGIYLGNLSRSVSVANNTLSGGISSIHIKNGRLHSISSNTLYNPQANAILVEETSDAYTGVVQGNTIVGNTMVSANPDYAMVRIDDMVDQNGTLATLTANNYYNLYKPKLPIIQVLRTGGDSTVVDKDSLATVDAAGQNFTAFGNRVYTSTGSYTGANLLSNGTFASNITGWSTDVLSLAHDSTGWTLHVSQGTDTIGTLSSNTFNITSGVRYEISGTIKNLTNAEGHRVHVILRKDVAPYTVYADRVLDVVATGSGKSFLEYVVANTTASDARLDIVFENPNTDFELDTLLVRGKQNVIFNARSNEVILLSNPTNASVDKSCSGWLVCVEYVDTNNATVNWNLAPINLGSYQSKIVFWNNSPFVLRPPVCSLTPSNGGTVANGQPITLTWSATNSLSNLLHYITNTGTLDISVSNSGAITFIPPDDITSHDVFTATNDIGSDVCSADIIASNTPPIAALFYATGSEDTAIITGSLQAMDFNSWDTITYSKIDDPSHGSLFVLTNGEVQYTPNPDYCGNDLFTFQARDNNGHTSDITDGQVQVLCVNDVPVAIDDAVTMSGNSTRLIDPRINDTDVDTPYAPQVFTLSGFTFPAHGSLGLSGWLFQYTPTLGYVGSDTFTYTIQDQSGELSNTGTINIMVTPVVNIPPVGFSGSYTLFEDGSRSATLSGSDANNDILSFSATILPLHGTLSLTSSGDFTYTPNPNYNGSDSFQFVAFDGQANSTPEDISFTITPIPDIPVVADDTVLVPKDGNSTILALQNDTDADNPYQPQTLTITGYTLPLNGTLSVVGTGFLYTPTLGFSGTDSFQYSIADQDNNLSNTGTVDITVSPVNQPPVASTDVFTGSEDTVLTATLSGSDPEGMPISYILDAAPINGTLDLSITGSFTFTPNPNFFGSVVFFYHVSDGILSSPGVAVTLNITSVNDTPVANNDTVNAVEDTPITLTGLLLNDTDADTGAILAIGSIVTSPLQGTAVLTGTNLIDYTPNPNFCGTDMFTYNTQDEFSAISSTATVNILVSCENDTPILTDSSWTATGNIMTNSGNMLVASLPSTDPDGDILTFTLLSNTATGVFTFTSSGIITYVPPLGFSGSDIFTYTAFDGFLTGATVTGTIIIAPNTYNVIPQSFALSFSGTEDTLITGTLTGVDVENDPLSYALASTGAHGVVTVLSWGTFTYLPNLNYNGGDSFTYTVSDPFGTSIPTTVTLTLSPVNDAPVVSSDSGTFIEDSSNNVLSPLLNDIDPDGDMLSFTWNFTSMYGTVSQSWQQLIYTPNPNSRYTDIINYSVTDGLLTSTGMILVYITNTPDPPSIPVNTFSVLEDSTTLLNIQSGATDPDGDMLTFTGFVTLPLHGTATLSWQQVLYTPNPNYAGNDSFSFQVTDSMFVTPPIVANIIITPVNDTPIANTDTATGTEDTPFLIPVLANDTDVDTGNVLSISSITTLPLHGTAVISGTGILYTPSSNYNGTDSLTYTVTDGITTSSGASVALTITSVNDAPYISPAFYTLSGNIVLSPGVLSGWTLSGYLESNNLFYGNTLWWDYEADVLSFTLATLPSHGQVTLDGSGFFAGSGLFMYKPDVGFVGLDTFKIVASDGINDSTQAPINFTLPTNGVYTLAHGVINVCIISPDPMVALPSCAPGYVAPSNVIRNGPGGGGGGGGGSSASSIVFAQTISNGISTGLASQLLLSNRVLGSSGAILIPNISTSLNTLSQAPYTTLLNTIQTVVTTTQDTLDLSPAHSSLLRKNAQTYIRSVLRSTTLTSEQKNTALDTTAKTVESLMTEDLSDRQYGTLQYILRLFNAKKTYLLPSMQVGQVLI